MFRDARNVPPGSDLEADVCIVGAGAAGITLARELDGSGLRVLLLESGRRGPDRKTQALYLGPSLGLPYAPLASARLRLFGGTTGHWAGYCRTLDEVDFEPRPWIPHSGWPIRRRDLDGYYERAHAICELGPPEYDGAYWSRRLGAPPLPTDGSVFYNSVTHRSPPTRFGTRYAEDIERSRDVTAVLGANVSEIELAENGKRVTRLAVKTLEGGGFGCRARRCVLACGGIENARLLLASNRVQPRGVGNQHDLVGRFFMDHLKLGAGVAICSRPVATTPSYYMKWRGGGGVSVHGVLRLSARVQAEERIGGLVAFLSASAPKEDFETLSPDEFPSRLWGVVDGAVDRWLGYRHAIYLRTVTEQVPNPESRVVLSRERDALDQPRAALDWRYGEQDERTIRAGLARIGAELGRTELGRLRLALPGDEREWSERLRWGRHHIGTTRMSDDPRRGVVDANGRVWGVSNLYVAGSSVFPTGGCAGPTLTIVALAARLADHLKEVAA